MPTGGLDIALPAFAATELGGIAGSALLGGELGAGLGGLESAVSGGNVWKGIERGGIGGALTGGGIGLGGDLIGGTIGDALGGAAGGALGGVATHSSPLTGALEGGVAGGIAGLSSPSAGGGTGGSLPGAAATAAPSGVDAVGGTGGDVTLSSDLSSPISSNVGSGTVGTQGLSSGAPGTFTGFGTGAGGAGIDGATGGSSAFTPAPKTSLQNFISDPGLKSAGNVLASNPGATLSGVGLGIDALKNGETVKGEKQIQGEAGQLASQGQSLQQYLASGSLPPGLQTGITQATNSAKATIRSQYAAKGMSGSSAEQQDLANADAAAQAQGAQLGLQLMNTGISETGMASQLYQQIMQSALQKDKDLGSAISSFASAAGGGTPTGTIKFAQE